MAIMTDRDPFGPGKWQDFLNQMRYLEAHGLSPSDVGNQLRLYKDKKLNWQIEQIQAAEKRRKTLEAKLLKCPECGQFMQVYPVNSDPKKRDRVLSGDGKEYNSMWLCGTSCSGKGCLYEEYSFLTVQEEIKKISQRIGE